GAGSERGSRSCAVCRCDARPRAARCPHSRGSRSAALSQSPTVSIIVVMNHPTQTRKPAPAGWPRISSAVFYDDAARAIDWLCAAFGFEVRLKVEGDGGRIEHSELTFGDGLIMVGSTGGRSGRPG